MGVCSSSSTTQTQSVHEGSGIAAEKLSARGGHASARGAAGGNGNGARRPPSAGGGSRAATTAAGAGGGGGGTTNNSTHGVSAAAASSDPEGAEESQKHSPHLGSAAAGRPPPTPILAGSRKAKKERPLANKYVLTSTAASTGGAGAEDTSHTPRLTLQTQDADALEAVNMRALSLDTTSGTGTARGGENANFLRVSPSPKAGGMPLGAGVVAVAPASSPKHGRSGSHGNTNGQRERDSGAYGRRRSRRSSEGRRLLDEAAAGSAGAGADGRDPRRLTAGSGKGPMELTAGGAAGAMGLPLSSSSPHHGTSSRRRATNPHRKSGVHSHPPKRRTSNNGMMSKLALQFPLVRTSFLAVYRAFERYMLVVKKAEEVVQERRRSQRNAAGAGAGPLLLLRVDDSKLAQAKHGTPSASSRGNPTASATPAAGAGRAGGAGALGSPGGHGQSHAAGEEMIQMLDESGCVVAAAVPSEGRALVDAVDAAVTASAATAAAAADKAAGDGAECGAGGGADGDDDSDMLSEEELRAREIAALLAESPTPLLLVPTESSEAAGAGMAALPVPALTIASDDSEATVLQADQSAAGQSSAASAATLATGGGLRNGASFTMGGVAAPASPQSHSASVASVALSLPSVSARRVRQLGTLTASRLGAALQAVTGSELPLPEAELLRLFQLADLDHSASISFREFLVAVAVGCFLREDIERDKARKEREAMAAAAGLPMPPPSPVHPQTKPPSPQPSPQPQGQGLFQSQMQSQPQPGLLRPISRGAAGGGGSGASGGMPPRSPVLPPTHQRGRSTSLAAPHPLYASALPPSPRRLELLDPIVGAPQPQQTATATTITAEANSLAVASPAATAGNSSPASSPTHVRALSISRGASIGGGGAQSLGVPPRTPLHLPLASAASSTAAAPYSHYAEVARGFRVVYTAFREMDEDASGAVDSSELKRALFSAAPMRSDQALLERRFAELDFDASGEIELAEFLYGVVAWVGLMDEDDQLEED